MVPLVKKRIKSMHENELYEAEKIIDGLNDPRLLQEVTAVKEIDPLDDLKL